MFEGGYLKLFDFAAMPVRAHLSLVFGLIVVGRLAPGAWLGYFIVLLAHLLGHLWVARRCRLRVHSIEMHALGGACTYDVAVSTWHQSLVAWGGVLGQLLLFGATVGLCAASHDFSFPPHMLQSAFAAAFGGGGRHDFAHSLTGVLLAENLIIAVFNLLPFRGVDGVKAWRLPRLLYEQRSGHKRQQQAARTTLSAPPLRRRLAGQGPELWLVRDENGDFRFELGDEQKSQREKKR